jgi:hypothetical protein
MYVEKRRVARQTIRQGSGAEPAPSTWVTERVENLSSYLRRKHREIRLIEGCAGEPAASRQAESVQELIERKFKAGADLKAQYAHTHWKLTETHWPGTASFDVGPFELSYLYQRADLSVEGTLPYDRVCQRAGLRIVWSNFTSCGMSAVASLVAALGKIAHGTVLAMRPDGYPETKELIEQYGDRLGVVTMDQECLIHRKQHPGRDTPCVLFLDSGVRARFSAPDLAVIAAADLIAFDTTCFALDSGRVATVLRRARQAGVPVVLVRSHTKLDSLGIEYGRLGSVVVAVPEQAGPEKWQLADRVAREIQAVIRLFGMAAVPAHLPPFLGSNGWRHLYRTRIARIIRNNRLVAAWLSQRMSNGWTVKCWHHGLFLTLAPPRIVWDEERARDTARELAQALRSSGLPIRCAGSFGFDFVVADAFPAAEGDRFILRIAVADLPWEIVHAVACQVADWTSAHQPKAIAAANMASPSTIQAT